MSSTSERALHSRFEKKRATVMGLGLFGGGLEVTRHLVRSGAIVTVTDLRTADKLGESLRLLGDLPVRLVLGEHRASDFTDTDVVIANPAVAPSNEYLARARAAGVEVSSELVLFLEATPARVVLITGTQGKSSTSNTTANLLAQCGFEVELGGNIGRSLLSTLDTLSPSGVAVVEISSYQLEALPAKLARAPRVAVVCATNVLADHLERHGTIENYEAAKRRILELAGDDSTAILNGEDERVSRWIPQMGRVLRYFATRGEGRELFIRDGCFRLDDEVLGRVRDLRLSGSYQRENTLAALGIARKLGAEPDALAAAIPKLEGLAHREQDLGVFGGRRVWDNGVSTTPDSTISVLRSLDRPLVLLIGGQKKNLPLDELIDEVRRRGIRVIAFGGSAKELADRFAERDVAVRAVGSVEEAVRAAFAVATSHDDILFSPACASFDAYRNFRDRALAFRAALPARDGD